MLQSDGHNEHELGSLNAEVKMQQLGQNLPSSEFPTFDLISTNM